MLGQSDFTVKVSPSTRIHLSSLVYTFITRDTCTYTIFFSFSSFHIDQKVSSPHVHFTSVSHRIQFLFFLPVPSSIHTVTSITLLLTSQLRSRVYIDVRPDSYGPFNFINSLGGRKIRRVHECQLVSPTEITILSVITSTQ